MPLAEHDHFFLAGGGTTGAAIRAYDWASSPLGPPETWPSALRTATGIMLASAGPVYIAWGDDLISLYNDGYLPIVGTKHPGIGLPFAELWAEVWEEFEPIVARTLAGDAQHFVDMPIALAGRPGIPLGYFTFSFTALRDDAGRVAGLYSSATETTERVLAEKRQRLLLRLSDEMRPLAEADAILRTATRLLGEAMGATRVTYCEIDEAEGRAFTRGDWTSGNAPALPAELRIDDYGVMLGPLRAGETLHSSDTLGHLPFAPSWPALQAIGAVAIISVPLLKNGRFVANINVHQNVPRVWTESEIDLVEAVAERTWEAVERARSEAELRQSESRFRSLITATGNVIFRMAPDWREMRVLYGTGFVVDTIQPRTDWITTYIPPDEQARVHAVIAQALEEGVAFELEHRVIRADGTIGWAHSRAIPLRGEAGEIVEWFGAASNISARVQSDQRYTRLFASSPTPFLVLAPADADFMVREVNDAYLAATMTTRELLLDQPLFGAIPANPEQEPSREIANLRASLVRVLETGQPDAMPIQRYDIMRPDGSFEERWWSCSNAPVLDADGRVEAIVHHVTDVTADLRTQAALRQSEERYRQIVEGADDFAIVSLDTQGYITGWNTGAQRMMGFSDAEALGERGDIFFTPEDRAAGEPARELERARATGRALNERWHMRKDGSRFWGSGLLMKLDQNGGGFVKMFRDRTVEHEAEAALRASEERFRTALEIETVGAIYFDMQGTLIDANDAFLRMSGYSRADLEAGMLKWQNLTPPEWMAESQRAFAELKATGRTTPYEKEYRRKDGSRWWALFAAKLLPDGTGFEFVLDMTERRQAEQRRLALVELSERIRDTRDPDDLAYAAAEILGRTLKVSRAGYGTINTADETIAITRDWNMPGINSLAGVLHFRDYGSYIEDLKRGETVVFADADTDPRTAATADALKAISAQSVVNMPVTEQGGFVALLYLNHATARAWPDEELALIREVAERTRTAIERLRAEADLRASEARLRELNETLEQRVAERTAERDRTWNNSRDLLVVVGTDGIFRAVSPAWTKVLGWTPAELLGRCYLEFLHVEDHPANPVGLSDAFRNSQPIFENRYRRKDGSYRWISWIAVPEDDAIYATGRDITEEKERQLQLEAAQEQLRQSQKMEAMGSLTGGVAHDFNNLLTPIVGTLDMLQRTGVGNERERRLIAAAVQSADRARTLVQRLLAFARRQPLQPIGLDLAPLVDGMADLIASTTGPQIRVVVDAPRDLPPAKADPNQLEMAILNLAVNARDAMPDGGTLRISVDFRTISGEHHTRLAPGGYLRVSVADTGQGMDEATLKRAVEPFFSTKGIGKGTGLGLSMVHGLASQLGGALTIRSTPGVGTHVELWLPQSAEQPLAGDAATDQPAMAKSSGTALLVDDEELVRLSTADMLAELGYAVIEAASASDALKLIEGGLQPDLLITDHLMPGMTGTELARTLRDHQPGLKVLVVSGYAESEGITPDLPRLAKPFRNADLAATLAVLA